MQNQNIKHRNSKIKNPQHFSFTFILKLLFGFISFALFIIWISTIFLFDEIYKIEQEIDKIMNNFEKSFNHSITELIYMEKQKRLSKVDSITTKRETIEKRKECPVCPQGRPGKPGLPGDNGIDGEPGMPGLNASFTLTNISLQKECIQCPAGMPGPVGLPGFPGLPGLVGTKGIQGCAGRDGEIGLTGPPGDSGITGQAGLEVVKLNASRGLPGDVGPPGPVGQIGPQGPKDFPGIQGPPGKKGPIGEPGTDGHYCSCNSWRKKISQNSEETINNYNESEAKSLTSFLNINNFNNKKAFLRALLRRRAFLRRRLLRRFQRKVREGEGGIFEFKIYFLNKLR